MISRTVESDLMMRMRFMILLVVMIMLLSLARSEIIACLVPATADMGVNPGFGQQHSGPGQPSRHVSGDLKTPQSAGAPGALTPGT